MSMISTMIMYRAYYIGNLVYLRIIIIIYYNNMSIQPCQQLTSCLEKNLEINHSFIKCIQDCD